MVLKRKYFNCYFHFPIIGVASFSFCNLWVMIICISLNGESFQSISLAKFRWLGMHVSHLSFCFGSGIFIHFIIEFLTYSIHPNNLWSIIHHISLGSSILFQYHLVEWISLFNPKKKKKKEKKKKKRKQQRDSYFVLW